MNRNQASELIKNTFTQAFDKTRFRTFAMNLLNHVDVDKAFARNTKYIKDAFKAHIQRFERLGTYKSPDDETLDVLIVHLTKESTLERARTGIRNFVADHLKVRDGKDAALVAFVSPAEKQWRFSYVKMEYAAVEKESGKVGVETHLTPARRYSYIVGEGESCHTAQTRFLGLLQNTAADPSLSQIEEAFSVEAVTKEFFARYVNLFGSINTALEKLGSKDKTLRDEFKGKGVNTVDFAKKLMGQIVFLYFLQKKGWLGVEKGKDWGSGPHDFLRRMANGEYGRYTNFFNDVLEPLFYDTLATDRGHDAWCSRFKCRIPFLNGGLFEPLRSYDWRKTDINLPNNLFTNTDSVEEGITGTGVLDVFDRYNFTVNEAEPLEKEVAIDPEMLGKVFENLIEENRRKGLGAFYTPREIVHYMCQESLINYLDTAVNTANQSLTPKKTKQGKLFGEEEPEQGILTASVRREAVPRSDIETFIRLGEQISYYEAVDTAYPIKMPKSVEKHAKALDDALKAITVCDPAVGSGAFPVGMMTEVVRARLALTPYFNDVEERTSYHFKRHAIQNCLYGVDIDPGAVEIAKLRLWLSLVVDEEDVKQIKPLPNLDYKIVTGNSLLGVEENLFNDALFKRLEKLKPEFFDETDPKKKAKLREEIESLIHDLTSGHRVFDFKVYFSEVSNANKGFGIVIANPPYIGESGHKDLFRETKEGPLGPYYLGKMDFFYFFFHLALNLTKPKGEIAFISTNYYLTAAGARKLRADLKRRGLIRRLIDFNELRIFESAQGQHNIVTLLSRDSGDKHVRTCITKRTGQATPDILSIILGWKDGMSRYYEVPQPELYDGRENYIRLNRGRVPLGTSTPSISTILDKVAAQNMLLGTIATINQGVVSGCDYVSSRNEQRLPPDTKAVRGDGIFVLNLENPRDMSIVSGFSDKEKGLLRKFYKNSDIDRYSCADSTSKRLLYIGRDLDDLQKFPRVLKHLSKFKSILTERREVQNGVIRFFQLQWPRTEGIFTGKKIVVPYRSEKNAFAYDETEWFCRSDCYVITPKHHGYDLYYLLALLNSRLYFQWLFHRGKRKGKMLEMFQIPLSEIPIKCVESGQQKPFIDLAVRILAAKRGNPTSNTAEIEKRIDCLVYDLYGLSPEEIKIVECES